MGRVRVVRGAARPRRVDGANAWPSLMYSAPSRELSLTAFLCFLKKALSYHGHDNEEIMDGLWRGEMRCIGPKAKDSDV